MADNIATGTDEVNVKWSFGSMFDLFVDLFRPVCKVGEMYSLDQATARLRVGDATIRGWEPEGLRAFNPPGTKRVFYKGEDLIEFVSKYSRLDKTD